MPTSNYLRGKLIDTSLRGVTYAAPVTVYASLHTADPTVSALPGSEVVGTWYARQASAFSAQVTAGETSNTAAVTYNAVTDGAVSVTHFAVWDSLTLGNMLYFGTLSAAKTFSITDVPSWLPTQLAVKQT